MGKCEKCGKQIDDRYKYCQKCNSDFARENAITEIAKTLKQINWNLGIRNEFMKRTNPELWEQIQKEWKEKNTDPDLD